MSTAESARAKMPPGPALPAARRILATMASTLVGSSPITRFAKASTAAFKAGVRAPPKKVRPTPTRPWSVPSSSVTNSRVSVGSGSPTTRGLSAGVRRTRVVTCVIFIGRTSLGAGGSEGEKVLERGEHRVGIVLVEGVNGAGNLHETSLGELAPHALRYVAVEDRARLAAQDQGRRGNRAHDTPPVEIGLGAPLFHAGMPLPHDGAVGAVAETRRRDPAVVVDARIWIAAVEMLGGLLDAFPRLGLGRPCWRLRRSLADLRPDVDDHQLLHAIGPLRGEVHAVAPAHGQPHEDKGRQAELIDDSRDVLERRDGVVDLAGIAVAVAALVHRVDVEMRLQRDAERVPGMRVPRESVQEEERGAIAAAPVEHVELEAVDDDVAVDRTEEVHGGSHDSRIALAPPSLDVGREGGARSGAASNSRTRKDTRWRSAAICPPRDLWRHGKRSPRSRARPTGAAWPRCGSATTSSFRGPPPAAIRVDAFRIRLTKRTSSPWSPSPRPPSARSGRASVPPSSSSGTVIPWSWRRCSRASTRCRTGA